MAEAGGNTCLFVELLMEAPAIWLKGLLVDISSLLIAGCLIGLTMVHNFPFWNWNLLLFDAEHVNKHRNANNATGGCLL